MILSRLHAFPHYCSSHRQHSTLHPLHRASSTRPTPFLGPPSCGAFTCTSSNDFINWTLIHDPLTDIEVHGSLAMVIGVPPLLLGCDGTAAALTLRLHMPRRATGKVLRGMPCRPLQHGYVVQGAMPS